MKKIEIEIGKYYKVEKNKDAKNYMCYVFLVTDITDTEFKGYDIYNVGTGEKLLKTWYMEKDIWEDEDEELITSVVTKETNPEYFL